MTPLDLPARRLAAQHISRPALIHPDELAARLGAVQAQDYGAAKWALGLRLPGDTDEAVEQAFSAGTILRTHVLRPTWHFVAPADIRWMLALTAARVHARNTPAQRQLGLDADIFRRSNAALERALRDGKQLTRPALDAALREAGIATADLRFTHLIMRAELDGLLCSGPRQGKQFTYMLLEERVPAARKLERDEALAELARRFFTSHGPATLADFTWWSSLSTDDARAGVEMAHPKLAQETIGRKTYWFAETGPAPEPASPAAYLLPNYDEYVVGYTDRSAISSGVRAGHLDARGNVLFNNTIILDGLVAGTWRRTLRKNAVEVELNPFSPLDEAARRAVVAAAERYGAFLGLAVVLKSLT